MDSVTHIVLGACIGEAIAGKKLGKRAMLWGAIAQSIPDIDVTAALWTTTTGSLLAHRGFTHSILCCLLLTPLLALLAVRWSRKRKAPLRIWLLLFGVELFTHIFIDAFNSYGTGWFEPFSHYRVAFNTIFVADPLFTIFPIIGTIALLILRNNDRRRRIWWRLSVIGSTAYLAICIANKAIVTTYIQKSFAIEHIPHDRYFVEPSPLNNLLWYMVACNDSDCYTGYRSVFDTRDTTPFHYFRTNKWLITPVAKQKDVRQLVRFSKGYYTIEQHDNTIIFNDLRFGQIGGWEHPDAPFVFYYYLNKPDENKMIVQRGRIKGWDKDMWQALFERIACR